MASLDDLPLGSGPGDGADGGSSAPPASRSKVVLFGVLAALVLAAGVWYYQSRQRAADAPAAALAAPATPAAAQALIEPTPAAPELPPLAEMDPFVRELFATLGAHPELLKWLATDDLVGAIVTAVDRLAEGQTPARDLAVLRPAGRFAVVQQSGVTRTDPASYLRYAPLVSAVTTVSPTALAAAYTTLKPRLEEAYIRQGHPNGGFDQAVRRAIEVVTTTPDAPADAALVPGVGGYAYGDPALERLLPAQKHLLRMGPDLSGRVREAVRQFAAALTAPPSIPVSGRP